MCKGRWGVREPQVCGPHLGPDRHTVFCSLPQAQYFSLWEDA